MKFLQKDIDKFEKMSDKRKYKKGSFAGKERKAWNRGKRTKMPVTVVKFQTGGLKLNKKELLHTNFQGFLPDLKNTNFSEYHLNGCFCRCFIFQLQCISPASNAKSFRLEIRL